MARNYRMGEASAISDRSGVRYPMSEMVKEPGTNYLVHYSESDGQFSLVEHPTNNLHRYIFDFDDPKPVENARPEQPIVQDVNYSKFFKEGFGQNHPHGRVNIKAFECKVEFTPSLQLFYNLNIEGKADLQASANYISYVENLEIVGESSTEFDETTILQASVNPVQIVGGFDESFDESFNIDSSIGGIEGKADLIVNAGLKTFEQVNQINGKATLEAFCDVGLVGSSFIQGSSELTAESTGLKPGLVDIQTTGSLESQARTYISPVINIDVVANLESSGLITRYGETNIEGGKAFVTASGDTRTIASTNPINGTSNLAANAEILQYGWTQVGETGNVSNVNSIALLEEDTERVGLIKDIGESGASNEYFLETWEFSGSTWSQVGNPSSYLPNVYSRSKINVSSENNVALFNGTNKLVTYSFYNNNWSQIGNTLENGFLNSFSKSFNNIGFNTFLLLMDDGGLQPYYFNGSSWSQTGTPLYLTSESNYDVAATNIGNNNIAICYEKDFREIKFVTYKLTNNNNTWTKIGNELIFGGSVRGNMVSFKENHVVLKTSFSELNSFIFDGVNWNRIGSPFGISQGSLTIGPSDNEIYISSENSIRKLKFILQ